MITEEYLTKQLYELAAKHASYAVKSVSLETRLGEDLRIVGDDAEEFLEEYARNFNVDLSAMTFSDYFPDEAGPEMNYYLTAIWCGNDKKNTLTRPLRLLEAKFWKIFAKKTSYKTITIRDLLVAAQKGKWD